MSEKSVGRAPTKEAAPLPLRCNLEDVLLMECSASRSVPAEIDPSIHTLHLRSTIEPIIVDAEKRVLQAFATCKLQSLSESEKQAFSVDCRFLLRYSYDGPSPKAEEQREFEESIVKFNVWPYFRECLQSLAQRMQFNPPPLPILKVLPKTSNPAAAKRRKKLKSTR